MTRLFVCVATPLPLGGELPQSDDEEDSDEEPKAAPQKKASLRQPFECHGTHARETVTWGNLEPFSAEARVEL